MGSVYVLQHTFNIQLGNLQIHLSPYFLFEQSLKVNQTWVFRAFSGLFWAFAPPGACVLFDFQEYVGTFQRLYSPKYLTVQFSLPGFLVCLLFAQIVISFPRWQQLINFLLNVSDKCSLGTHLSASDKFWVRRSKEEPFAPVLQGATRQVKTH